MGRVRGLCLQLLHSGCQTAFLMALKHSQVIRSHGYIPLSAKAERGNSFMTVNRSKGGQRKCSSFTIEWTVAMEAREGTHSQLSELGQWRPERYTHSQLSELGQWRPQRVLKGQWKPQRILIYSWVNWDSGGQRGYSFTVSELGNGGQRGHSFTAVWTGTVEAREGTSSQLSDLGQWRPQRVLIHSWVNWDSGGQRYTHSQLSELGQWRPERILIHSWVNWDNGGLRGTHSQLSELGLWRPKRYSFTVEWTGTVEAREDTVHVHSWVNWDSGGQRGRMFTAVRNGAIECGDTFTQGPSRDFSFSPLPLRAATWQAVFRQECLLPRH